MTVEEMVRLSNSSVSVAYQKFVLMYGHSPNDLICFFEGHDAQYYHLRIKSYYNGGYQYISCNGKRNVILLHHIIRLKYRKAKVAFFIDRDYDRTLKNKYKFLYETPTYSIENLYCGEEVISDILKSEFGLVTGSSEYLSSMNLYKKIEREFLSAALFFNLWYYAIKKKAERSSTSTSVNLSSHLPKSFIIVYFDRVVKSYGFSDIMVKFPGSILISESEVLTKKHIFLSKILLDFLRGKYVLNDFFIPFLRNMITDANTVSKRVIIKQKVTYNVHEDLSLSQMSQYARTPECLKVFIRSLPI